MNQILFHKFQGETLEGYNLARDDIMIVIQSPFQRSMLRKFGSTVFAVTAHTELMGMTSSSQPF